MTFALVTLALAIAAQTVVVGLLLSGWSVMDIFVGLDTAFGFVGAAFLSVFYDLLLAIVRALTTTTTRVCSVYCGSAFFNATEHPFCANEPYPNIDCFLGGIVYLGAMAIVVCPLGVWLICYASHRWEQSSKSKTE